MKTLLKEYFGYDNFKPMQEEIIKNTLQKKDSLVIMPTGGGKSLCYQIPALQFEGLTLVISPLISLMKDQVDNLKANGISAEYINSTLLNDEIINIQKKIIGKEIKLLYIAPERLALESFMEFLKKLQISLIAIDEAHCISEWGHDFRPEYRNLKVLKTIFANIPIIALTATATKRVQEDILKQLNLTNPSIFASSFNRNNLNLIIERKKNTFGRILEILKNYKGNPAIIYCFSRKDSEKIAQDLRKRGFNALSYHAGLSNEVRKNNQELFIKDKADIIVATIAFGMGIDKPDVRLIIHHTFPKSLEGYYQEIGRAGRDGLPSDCILFYSSGDKRKHEYFINKIADTPTQLSARTKLAKVMSYCEAISCRRRHILEYFGETFPEYNCNGCDICLKSNKSRENIISDKIKIEKSKEPLHYDKMLFEKLRVLRKQIAGERKVPPFIIFGDVSLQEMSFYFPQSNEEFLEINGVGSQKSKDFGDLFLEVIRNHIKEGNLNKIGEVDAKTGYCKRLEEIKKQFPNAYEPWKEEEDIKLKNLYYEKKTINEIAQILSRQPGAIQSRLNKLGLIS